jgi:hypothetical protein
MRYIIDGEIDILLLASHDDLHWLLCRATVIVLYMNNVNDEENSVWFT